MKENNAKIPDLQNKNKGECSASNEGCACKNKSIDF